MDISSKLLAGTVALLAPIGTACDRGELVFVPEVEALSSFEQGLDGWSRWGVDLDNPPVSWSIERSQEQAAEGSFSLRFEMNNLNDAGKIWVEKPFTVEPNQSYEVAVAYSFGTSDFGDVNHWTLITGVHSAPPRAPGTLTFQGSTANGESADNGLIWIDRSYELNARSAADGLLYVAVGVWGTWETRRVYYLDDVTVSFTRN